MNMQEVRKQARERMKGFCRVCPICDGRACAGEVPGMGGLGTGSAFRANLTALAAVRLNMRLIHDVKIPDTTTEILGFALRMPVLAAPVAGVSFNMGGWLSEEAYDKAVVSGCRTAGLVACTGDGALPMIFEAGLDAIRQSDGLGIPVVKPWDGEELDHKMDMAAKAGCTVIGMDIDAAGLVTLAKMGHPVTPKSPAQLTSIVARAHSMGMKCIIKGIMTVSDALLALEAGCDAIVVSNHGGRVLDHTPGTASVLPGIADALKGRLTLLVDGGVRDGVDIFKMLALGADAVLVGRPFAVAAMGGGLEGVTCYCEQIYSQLVQAMILTGCPTLAHIDRKTVLFHEYCVKQVPPYLDNC